MLIHRLRPLQVPATTLWQRLRVETDPSARTGLLMALGEYELAALGNSDQQNVAVARVIELFQTANDAATHAAAEWLLREWEQNKVLTEWLKAAVSSKDGATDRNWSVTPHGHTMVMIDARSNSDIGIKYSLANKEVSAAQFEKFWHRPWNIEKLTATLDCPAQVVNWYAAIAYCQWLNEEEGVPESEWCYPKFDYTKAVLPRFEVNLARTGYRLPTTAEWEFAYQGGSTTRYHFGQSHALLPHYAWLNVNSQGRTWPVGSKKPNGMGFFGLIGNVAEWHADLVQDDRVSIGGGTYGSQPEVHPIESGGALPNTKYNSYGFRIARTIRPPQK